MLQNVDMMLPVPVEPQQPRRRRLYELIIAGFEHLLSQQQGHACIDGRGAGYVVWVPCREQYQEVWNSGMGGEGAEEEEEEEEEDGSRPLVLYGGGYDGLFQVGTAAAKGWLLWYSHKPRKTWPNHSFWSETSHVAKTRRSKAQEKVHVYVEGLHDNNSNRRGALRHTRTMIAVAPYCKPKAEH